jgi:hypothetical protein
MRTSQATLLAVAMLVSTSLCSAAPERRSNSQRYAETGIKNAQGRSGAASLMGRILYAKDGTSLVELTTGNLDAATAPGTISKVQLKGVGSDGTVNYGNYKEQESRGQWQLSLKDFRPGQNIQVLANVRDIDPTRTDVVTLNTTVARRPDVTVVSIDLPQQIQASPAPITFTANVRELNGHAGQTTDCVLYLNGVAVDKANSIWIAARDTVTCAFTRQFATVGTHNVKVALENGKPYDDDTTNNTKAHTITVVSPQPTYWSATIAGVKQKGWWLDEGEYRTATLDPNDFHHDWRYYREWDYDYTNTDVHVYNYSSRVTFPLAVTSRHIAGSTVVYEGTAQVEPYWTDGFQTCGERWMNEFTYTSVCTWDYGPGNTGNYLYELMFGKVFYHSEDFDRRRSISNPGWNNEYSYVWTDGPRSGVPSEFLSISNGTWTFDLSINGSNGAAMRAAGTLGFDITQWSNSRPLTCGTYDPPTGEYSGPRNSDQAIS